MLKHYVEFFYPGVLFAESSSVSIDARESFNVTDVPTNAYAYRFYDREEIDQNDEKLVGPIKHISGFYFFGKVYDADDVVTLFPEASILARNMQYNGWNKVVKTRCGNWQPFDETTDRIVEID